MAFDWGICDEVVEMRVVGESGRIHDRRRVVHQFSEEAESLLLFETCRTKLTDLHLERVRLVVQRSDRSIQLGFQKLQRVVGREPHL